MMQALRKLTKSEIIILEKNGCTAENWGLINVAPDFDASRVLFTQFLGEIVIGTNCGFVNINGLKQRSGIYHAVITNCRIGNYVYIANIGSSIRNYVIEDNVIIEDVSILISEKVAQFGNGVKVSVLNETGGREVTLFNDLNAQIAYLQAMYRHDNDFQEKLEKIIQKAVVQEVSNSGKIAGGAIIRCCGTIKNVNIGPSTIVQGALELNNGTILSCHEHPTVIGSGVILKDFIISEGAEVKEGALFKNTFVGQGTQAGKQVSAENSLFFANSEAFHSEICSVFAGPYTVTHHRSSLLIASLWSFFNAGSGMNQSNHMYKLGPIHQGVFERGCKTGSFAYNMFESHIPAFSVVIGKHMVNINIPLFPFSYVIEVDGHSNLMPGNNLLSIGTVRDSVKWPARDRRKCSVKRDHIIFDVFSPYTIEKMRRGKRVFQDLDNRTPKGEETIQYGGIQITRLRLKRGIKFYTMAIDRYLIGKILTLVEEIVDTVSSWSDVIGHFQSTKQYSHPDRWVDLGGLIALSEKIEEIMEDVTKERIVTVDDLLENLRKVHSSYHDDEMVYVCYAVEEDYGFSPCLMSVENFTELVEKWEFAATTLHALILENTKSEFSDNSMISYGIDQDEEQIVRDFTAVRGTFDTNPVVKEFIHEKDHIRHRVEAIKKIVKELS